MGECSQQEFTWPFNFRFIHVGYKIGFNGGFSSMVLWLVSKFRRFRFTVSEALVALF